MEQVDLRQERGLLLAQSSRLKMIVTGTWLVPSQSQNGGYVVDLDKGTCTCPDHELRGETVICKHRWAVRFARHQVPAPSGKPLNTMRVTYSQNWPAYNAAQYGEKDQVMVLLRSLCDGVHNEPQPGRGRPRAALSDVIFAATMKTFVGMSGRRATSDLNACVAGGFLDRPIAYNTIFDYLDRADLTPILKQLVRRSALPLATLETKFAIDGTGFSSQVYRRWFDAKYGKEMKESTWVKLHAVCGIQTGIITAVEATDAYTNDSPLLPQLVKETAENFAMEQVLADKGYLGVRNFEAIESVGAQPFVAFKSNSGMGKSKVWNRAFHLFSLNKEEWLPHYNQRSNVEAVFSAVKRKFGGSVRSKLQEAQFNEVLLKCLCHNLSCLVHAIHELGIEPQLGLERR